jgi:hypothetical protein
MDRNRKIVCKREREEVKRGGKKLTVEGSKTTTTRRETDHENQ